METEATPSSKRFLTFRVDAQLYALPAAEVLEVIRLPDVARVPQGPAALRGLVNLRGAVVPLAGLREMLGSKMAGATSAERALVLDIGAPVAVVVDSVDALETAGAEQLETRPQELGAQEGEKLLGAFLARPGGPVTKILDIRALLDQAFTPLTRQLRADRKMPMDVPTARAEEDAARLPMLLTFEVAGQEYALPLTSVEEILPLPATIAPVAHAEAIVLGLTSFRNTLMPLVSLRGLLGLEANVADNGRNKIIVITVNGAPIGLVADAARDVISADPRLTEAVPPFIALRTGGESRIQSVYRGNAGQRLISILSPERLFREDVMQRLAALPPGELTQPPPVDGNSDLEVIFLVFRLGAEEFGLPVEAVVEVAQVPEKITRVPKTPKFLEGIVNLRGEVLPVIDQRRRFDMPPLGSTAIRRLVVLKTERHRAGIIVDSVTDVLRLPAEHLAPPPILTSTMSGLVRGVINLASSRRMVLILDPTELLTRAEQGLLDTFQAQRKKADA